MEFWPLPRDFSPVETGQEDLGWRVVQSLSKRNAPGRDVRLKGTEQCSGDGLGRKRLPFIDFIK